MIGLAPSSLSRSSLWCMTSWRAFITVVVFGILLAKGDGNTWQHLRKDEPGGGNVHKPEEPGRSIAKDLFFLAQCEATPESSLEIRSPSLQRRQLHPAGHQRNDLLSFYGLNLLAAARANGKAKEALMEVESARMQLWSQWRIFLQQSVIKWKEYTAQFQASEAAFHAQMQEATMHLHKTQRIVDLAKKRADATSRDDEATPATQSAEAHRATNGDQARHQSKPSAVSATLPHKRQVDVTKCHACHAKGTS